MKGQEAKLILVDVFENLASRIQHAEQQESTPREGYEQSKHQKEERRKALETIREEITRYRLNL